MIRDDVDAALPMLRAQAESLMTLTVTVTRIDGSTTTVDPDTGVEAPAVATVYSGAADLVQASAQAHVGDSAGVAVVTLAPVLKLPLTAPRLAAGDAVALADGRRYVVRADVTHAHPVTARYQLDGS